ncbi:MAG: hypothetical protein PVI99_08475 [Anaerolineales bacterium]|jgi:hypothetical protein
MEKLFPTPSNNARIGFQYFPDTYHYREADLITWLPELVAMGAQWLVLETPAERAIPEDFLRPMISSGIEPILKFNLTMTHPPDLEQISMLIDVYAQWGVHYITLFDRPNTLAAWSQDTWVQQNLVNRFLNAFIPLAEYVSQAGIHPVFPGLEPGGNFWDTAFLRSALQEIKERGHTRLLKRMVIGAYAWSGEKSLNWGAGGPKAWPGVRPYFTPNDEQDHLGFRIFDWYTAITEDVLGHRLPMILLGTGASQKRTPQPNQTEKTRLPDGDINFSIANLLAGSYDASGQEEIFHPIPHHVIAGCFTQIFANARSAAAENAWFSAGGKAASVVDRMKQWTEKRKKEQNASKSGKPDPPHKKSSALKTKKPIKHYLLLPRYKWGIEEWYLEVTRPFIKKYRPTVGFSMREAFLAEKVTIIGGKQAFPERLVTELERSGAKVVEISGNGTEIATKLARY